MNKIKAHTHRYAQESYINAIIIDFKYKKEEQMDLPSAPLFYSLSLQINHEKFYSFVYPENVPTLKKLNCRSVQNKESLTPPKALGTLRFL